MVYGWRNNPVAATCHFTAAAMFADCAERVAKISTRLPMHSFKSTEYKARALMEEACGVAALVDKWVRVGSKHRWEVK